MYNRTLIALLLSTTVLGCGDHSASDDDTGTSAADQDTGEKQTLGDTDSGTNDSGTNDSGTNDSGTTDSGTTDSGSDEPVCNMDQPIAEGDWGGAAASQDRLAPETCGGPDSGNEWILGWAAGYDGCYELNTTGATFDTVAYVKEGSSCDGDEIACDDDSNGTQQSIVRWYARAGQDFLLVVDAYSPEESGDAVFGVHGTPGGHPPDFVVPAGDTGDSVVSGTTSGASVDVGSSDCANERSSGDVIVQWIAPWSGTFTFDTNGSAFDTILQLMTNCGAAVCDDDDGTDYSSSLTVSVSEGDLVQLAIFGYDGQEGSFRLNVH